MVKSGVGDFRFFPFYSDTGFSMGKQVAWGQATDLVEACDWFKVNMH